MRCAAHSGVQGGRRWGAYADGVPGGVPIAQEVPSEAGSAPTVPDRGERGLSAAEMGGPPVRRDRRHLFRGGKLPESARQTQLRSRLRACRSACTRTSCVRRRCRRRRGRLALPAMTRTSRRGAPRRTTERLRLFSPESPGPRVGRRRGGWEIHSSTSRAAYIHRTAHGPSDSAADPRRYRGRRRASTDQALHERAATRASGEGNAVRTAALPNARRPRALRTGRAQEIEVADGASSSTGSASSQHDGPQGARPADGAARDALHVARRRARP